MAKITFEDKVALNVNSDIADVNKCNATDLNEIKNVVNENDDNTITNTNNIANNTANIGTLSSLNTTSKNNLVSAINEVNTNDIRRSTYTTSEQVVGKWVDGKPIYRKVFSFNLGSTINAWSTIGTIANIKLPIRFYGMCWNGTTTFNIPRAYDGEDITLYCDTGSKLFREQHNYSYANNLPAFAVIEYTKTTD